LALAGVRRADRSGDLLCAQKGRGACARHRQACVGVVRAGAVLWQAHRGELRRRGGAVPPYAVLRAPGFYGPTNLVQKD